MKISRYALQAVITVVAFGYAGPVWADEQKTAEKDEVAISVGDSARSVLDRIYILGDREVGEPGANSQLSGQAIENIAADHPAEVLNVLPSVNVQMNSGQEHLIAIRSPVLTGGAGQGSFLTLQNGVPTRSPAFGNVNMLIDVHHEIAEGIEVVRGPGSAKYGSNAVHGLMNFILPQAGSILENRLNLSASSLGRLKGDVVLADDTAFVGVSLQHDNGWRDATGVDQQKISAGKLIQIGDWTANAWFSGVNLNQETAGFIQGPDAYKDKDLAKSNPNPEAFRDAQFAMGAIRFEHETANLTTSITPYARWQDMTFLQHFLPYKGLEENSHSAFGVMGDVGASFNNVHSWRLGGMVDFASGDLTETQDNPFGFFPGDTRFPVGRHYDYTVDTKAAAIWAELAFALSDQLQLTSGLRVETHEYDYTTHIAPGISGRFNVPDDRTDHFDLVTPKLGLIWSDFKTGLSIYANYARGQRAPQASDLYRLQNQQVIGDVKSETLDSFEVGVRRDIFYSKLSFDIAAYVMKKKNFFFRDSQGLNVPNGKTDHVGIEASFEYDFSDFVTLRGNLSWADHTYDFDRVADNIQSGNKVDTAPEWLSDLSLVVTPTDDLSFVLDAEYVGKYFMDAGNQSEYGGHTLVSGLVTYQIADDMELWGRVRNLFDERYADRGDVAFGNERYFPGEPQSLTIGVRKRW